jgi:hypothetical protein
VRAISGQAPCTPSAPQPSGAVRKLLDEAGRLLGSKERLAGRQAADRALEAARSAGDGAGEARAQEQRAKANAALDRRPEAVTACINYQTVLLRFCHVRLAAGPIGCLEELRGNWKAYLLLGARRALTPPFGHPSPRQLHVERGL